MPDADRSVLDRRHLEPVAAGIGFAVAFAALDLAVPLGIPHVAFPHAVPFYLYGAVATELLFRLVPISVAVWLVARVRPGRRWQAGTFAATAALTALVEPFGLVEVVAPGGAVLVLVVGLTYALNLVGAALLWRYGLLAAVLERAAFYLGWHVAYGGLG